MILANGCFAQKRYECKYHQRIEVCYIVWKRIKLFDIFVDDNNPNELNPSSTGVYENQSMKDDVIDPLEVEQSDTISKKA
jgi:hypothetical protein